MCSGLSQEDTLSMILFSVVAVTYGNRSLAILNGKFQKQTILKLYFKKI